MNTFNSIEPQLITTGGPDEWLDQDASKYIPPEATGVILHLHNRDAGQGRYVGCRKKGSSLIHVGRMLQETHTWAICGVDENSIYQLWAESSGVQDFWVMGYTGANVHFLDTPIDYRPTLVDTWTDCDVGVQCPGALAGIFSTGTSTTLNAAVAIRKKGSTDDRYAPGYHFWAIIGLDANGYCQVKSGAFGLSRERVWLTGYISSLIETHTNAPEIAGIAVATWTEKSVGDLLTAPRWAIVEIYTTIGTRDWGLRKNNSLRDLKPHDSRHHFSFIHADEAGLVEIYKEDASVFFYLIAEIP